MALLAGHDWKSETYLSLAGVFQTKRENVVPVALSRFLDEHPSVRKIHLHLDNDAVGRGAVKGIVGGLQGRYQVYDEPPSRGKDVNDELKIRVGLKLSKQNVILYLCGIIPVVWLGLLIAPCLKDGLPGLVQQFGSVMQNPFKIQLCEDSVKTVLTFEDLFRIWMAEEAIDWYGYITRAANELKDEIAKMKLANQTPMEFGLKVRQDPNSLIATARNKMRSATQVSRPVTVSGKLLETPKLKANPEILKANEAAFKEFVDHLGSAGTRDFSVKPYYWRGVNKELVVQLLLDFETHPWHLAFQGRALAEYIDEKMDNETWDVALITDGEGSEYEPGLKCGSEVLPIKATERRSVIADDKMIRISGTKVKVGSGGCTRVGLTKEQIETARKRFKEQNGNKHMSDSAYLIRERSPLLMLHIIETDLDKVESTNREVPPYLFALGVGFPDTGAGIRTANYMVNMVELKNWMDPDEEEDE